MTDTEQKKSKQPSIVNGIGEIVGMYDRFLIDQWGVIHDGLCLYPGVLDAFEFLRSERKETVILTNSSKPNEINSKRLSDKFQFHDAVYDQMISSAHYMRLELEKQSSSFWQKPGDRVFCVADGIDKKFLDKSNLQLVENVDEADFVLLLSVAPGEGIQEHENWVLIAADRQLPIVCPSADTHSVSTVGIVNGLGEIIQKFQELGGVCTNFGKPERYIYQVIDEIFEFVRPKRVLVIGDQIDSDIVGANRQGYDSLLVLTGAAEARIGVSSPKQALEWFQDQDLTDEFKPTFIMSSLIK